MKITLDIYTDTITVHLLPITEIFFFFNSFSTLYIPVRIWTNF